MTGHAIPTSTPTPLASAAKAAAVAKAKALAPGLPARVGSTPKMDLRDDPAVFGPLFEELARKLKAHAETETEAEEQAVDMGAAASLRADLADLRPA